MTLRRPRAGHRPAGRGDPVPPVGPSLRDRTGWEPVRRIGGHAFFAPRVGGVYIGIDAAEPGAPHGIWRVPIGRGDSLLTRALFRGAVQLAAHLAPEIIAPVDAAELEWYLDPWLGRAERDILLWSPLVPPVLREWVRGGRGR